MASINWLGVSSPTPGADSEWSYSGGWSSGAVPGAGDTITVLAGSSTLVLTSVALGTGGPTTGTNVTVAAATVQSGASWSIQQYPHTVTITNNLEVDGGMSITDPFDLASTTINIGGTLIVTNSGGAIGIGNYLQGAISGGGGISTTVLVTASAVANSSGTNNGSIVVDTDVSDGSTATLDITNGAAFSGQANILVGNVQIGTDGTHAGGGGLLEFATGKITTIQGQNANFGRAQLSIYGSQSFLADSGSTTSNSALTGLAEIDGGLILQAGAAIATNGAVTIGSNGSLSVDGGFEGIAGSSFIVNKGNGTLTVNGSLSIGRSAMTGIGTVKAGAISSTGTITLDGADSSDEGKLLINGTAGFGTTGVLTGNVLMQDSSLLQFANGEITTIAKFASLQFSGGNAFIADRGSTTSNSALTGLTEIDGSLTMQGNPAGSPGPGGTQISTSSLTIGSSGNVSIDGGFLGTAGSLISVANTLTVNGSLSMGRSAMTGVGGVTAGTLMGTGTITVNGADSTDQGRLTVSDASGFSGTILINSDGLVEIGTTATGGGTFDFQASSGTVKFDTATTSGETFDGFVTGDTIDLAGLTFKSSYEAVFSSPGGSNGSSGTLNIEDTSAGDKVVASLSLADGNYNFAFATNTDGSNGTAVTLTSTPQSPSTPPSYPQIPGNNDEWILSNGQWAASAAPGSIPSGYQVAGTGDFSGNGTSDILWQNPTTGDTQEWLINYGGWAGTVDLGSHPGSFQVAGTGDFTGNGIDDVLWTSSSGGQVQTDIWELGSNGQWTASVSPGSHPAGYEVVGIGDFTGNGTDDILWQNPTTGDVDEWQLSNGQWAASVDIGPHPGSGWQVAGVGDFTGNGISDVLWTNSSNGQVQTDIWELGSNGQWINSVSPGSHPAGYQVAGIGDFTGNGTDDILWQNSTTGDIDEWQLSNGQWAGSVDLGAHPGNTPVSGVGNLTGNGTSDILFHTSS